MFCSTNFMFCHIDPAMKAGMIGAIAIITAALIAGLFNIYKDKDKSTRVIIGVISLIIIIAGTPILFVLYYPDEESRIHRCLERVASSTPPSSPAVQVNIVFPVNKDKVPEFITMEGTATGDVKNAHLWIVSRQESTLNYFPQGEEIHPTTNGDWKSSGVRIGAGQEGIGKRHELKVVQVNEIMHEAFQLYFKMGLHCNNKWIGFDHLDGTKELATVTVVRKP
jgi:hypothetical protein